MSGSLQPITIRLSSGARDALQAIADDCDVGEGRAASELMELALTGRARPADPRLTRKSTGAASGADMAQELRERQGRVLASLRAAVAEQEARRTPKEARP